MIEIPKQPIGLIVNFRYFHRKSEVYFKNSHNGNNYKISKICTY